MKRISSCLNKQLSTICQKVMQLDALQEKIIQHLPSNLQPHCQVASFNNGCLLLTVDDACWATELRYASMELRDALRKNGMYQLASIKIIVAS